MKQIVVLAVVATLGAAVPVALFGDPEAIYGRLQRNSYVPYPKPDYKQLYLALKNGGVPEEEAEQADYEYEASRPIGAIFEPQEDVMQVEDAPEDLSNQQWVDLGTLYDKPIDEQYLEQQSEIVRQLMNNYIDKKSETKKIHAKSAAKVAASTEAPASTTATTTSTGAPPRAKEHKEDKIPSVSKVHGQREYAMLRPAGAGEARRPLPDLWPEDVDVQQLKRAARRLYRKTPMDKLTSELDGLINKH